MVHRDDYTAAVARAEAAEQTAKRWEEIAEDRKEALDNFIQGKAERPHEPKDRRMTETHHGMKVLRTFDECFCPVKLVNDYDELNKLIVFVLPEYEVDFNADWIPEENIEWFAQVLARQLTNLRNHTEARTKKEIKGAFEAFIESMGGL